MGKINKIKFVIQYENGSIEIEELGGIISFGVTVTAKSPNPIIRLGNINLIKNGYIFDKYPWHEVKNPVKLDVYINGELFRTEDLSECEFFYTCSTDEINGDMTEFVEFARPPQDQ